MAVLLVWNLLLANTAEKLLLAASTHASVLFLIIILNQSLNLIFKPVSKLVKVSMIH